MPDDPWNVHLVRSPRRTKTVSARLVGNVVEVRVPQGLAPERERQLVDRLVARVRSRASRTRLDGDEALMRRAQELNQRYFQGRLQVNSVRYVTNQHSRFGSCTTLAGTIRLSDRLATMPDWVRDYVLVHELAHLLEPNHSSRFWGLVRRYPKTERAIGFLMAVGMGEESEAAG